MSQRNQPSKFKIVEALPIAPFLSFGLLIAWTQFAYNGFGVLPGLHSNVEYVRYANIASSLANALTLLAAGLTARKSARFLLGRTTGIACGCAASLASALTILVTSIALDQADAGVLLIILYCVAGAATAVVFLQIGGCYSTLAGREAIMNLSWSHVLAGGLFFVVLGMGDWYVPETEYPILAAIAFTLLPFLSAWLANIDNDAEEDKGIRYTSNTKALPHIFWKLVAVILILCFSMAFVNAASSSTASEDMLLARSKITNLLRIVIAFILIFGVLSTSERKIELGRVYTIIMVLSIAVVTMAPVMDDVAAGWGQLSIVVLLVFRMLHWIVLSLIVCQKRISPIIVFGFGAGVQTLGQGLGNISGTLFNSVQWDSSMNLIVSIALTLTIVICAFLLFSEKSFDELFKTSNDSEAELDELFAASPEPALRKEADEASEKSAFNIVIGNISEHYGLSKRESEVFRYIAMGYNAQIISEKLFISWNTVRGHSRNVYTKLGIHSRQELIVLVDQKRNNPKR